MGSQELFDRGWEWGIGGGRSYGSEELEEQFAGPYSKEWDRVGDYIGVDAVALGVETEIETDGHAVGICVWVYVGDIRKSRRVGESDGYGG
jgi:hypothetical protein